MENNIYFTQLNNHLVGLTTEEREDVLAFYREYATEGKLAGETLIAEFGTPKQLARRVLVDYSIRYDEVAEQAGVAEYESEVRHWRARMQRQFNLLWVVLSSLATSIIWLPALILILGGLLFVVVVAILIIVLLLSLLLTGIFQVIGSIAILMTNWPTALYQGGIGLMLLGVQLVAWPVGFVLVRASFRTLMKYVRHVGRRFLGKKPGGSRHA